MSSLKSDYTRRSSTCIPDCESNIRSGFRRFLFNFIKQTVLVNQGAILKEVISNPIQSGYVIEV